MPPDSVKTVGVEHCPVCQVVERTELFQGVDRLHGLPGIFPVVRCLNCGSAYLARRPADLAAYYPADSYAGYARAGRNPHYSCAPGRRYGLRRRRQLLESLRPEGGLLLDVGCGAGDFLALMRGRPGWQVMGIEPSAEAVLFAQDVLGLDVRRGQLSCPDLPTGQFDVITLWHVIEHVPNPHEVLNEVGRLLKPDGVCVIGVPVLDSVEADWFGPSWAGFDVPRHLVTFTRSSLAQIVRQAGLNVEERVGIVQSFASLRLSLLFWLEARGGLWSRWRRALSRLLLPVLFLYLRLRSGRRLSVSVFVLRPIGEQEVSAT